MLAIGLVLVMCCREYGRMPEASAGPRTLSDAVFLRLKSDIVTGALRPGTKLKITDLVERYDVGASPMREALARLTSEHLVVLQGQRGFTVSPISRSELEDLTRVRQLVECDAVARSIELGDVVWEARIVAAYFRLQRAHSTSAARSFVWSQEWERSNREFHDAVVSECGSPWLLRMQQALYAQCERYRHIAFENPRVPRDGDAEHKAIMDACLARKVELARRLTAEHIGKTAAAVAPLLSEPHGQRRGSRLARLLDDYADQDRRAAKAGSGKRDAAPRHRRREVVSGARVNGRKTGFGQA